MLTNRALFILVFHKKKISFFLDDRICKADMLRARKNKKVGAPPSGTASEAPKLGLPEKKRPVSPELNVKRKKKWAIRGLSLRLS